MYKATTEDIRLLKAGSKTWMARIEVLNRRFQSLAEIQGEVTSASCSIDSGSDIRRTCSLTVHVATDTHSISEHGYFWLDKLIRLSYGILNAAAQQYVYYPLGVFLLNDNDVSFSAEDNSLTLSLVDLMALATDMRGSALGAQNTVIEVNSNIRGAMISTLTQLVGHERYRIREFPSGQAVVPYDLEFDPGSYPYDILVKLRDLYPCNQMYFDTDGVFVCEEIPDNMDSPLELDESIMDGLIISESRSVSFSKVRNVTEIWGQELEAKRTADKCETNGDTYVMTIADITVMDDGVTYCLTPDKDNINGMKAQINKLKACPILVRKDKADGTQSDEPIEAGVMRAGLPYVLRYTGGNFYYYGELNVHGVAIALNTQPSKEDMERYEKMFDCRNIRYVVNPQDEFAVERIGMIKQVFTGGEYENIYTSELACQRAAYENWKSTRLQYTMTLETIIIPWLDVGKLIRYTSPATRELETALIDNIDIRPADGVMTLGLTRHYPYYPWGMTGQEIQGGENK